MSVNAIKTMLFTAVITFATVNYTVLPATIQTATSGVINLQVNSNGDCQQSKGP